MRKWMNVTENYTNNNKKMIRILTKTIIVVAIITIFIGPIFAINYKDIVLLIFKSKENAISYMQYVGTLIGGVATFVAILSTRNQTKQIINQNSNLIYNQTIIPKFEEIIRIANDIKADISNALISIALMQTNYCNNKEKNINAHDIDNIHKEIRNVTEICMKIRFYVEKMAGFNVYVNIKTEKDILKEIMDSIILMAKCTSQVAGRLPVDDDEFIDIETYNKMIKDLDDISKILKKISSDMTSIIKQKNDQIKSALKKFYYK